MSATAFQRLRREALAKDQAQAEAEEVNAEVEDIDKLKVAELKELLEEKGVEYDPKAKKEELIKLLKGAE